MPREPFSPRFLASKAALLALIRPRIRPGAILRIAAARASGYGIGTYMQIAAGIITVSDRASRGLYDDLGGPALRKAAEAYGWKVIKESLVPDEKRDIQRAIQEQIAGGCHLILTTGGTGVAQRDVTPEAVREIAARELPGFGEVMRSESLKITKNAILSRNFAAVVDRTLVIGLPGKPSGAVECLGFVVGAIPHCIEVLREAPTSC